MNTALEKQTVIQTVEDQELTVDQARQVIQTANEVSDQLRRLGPGGPAKIYQAFYKSANQEEFRKAIQMFGGGWRKFSMQNPKLIGGFYRIARELNTVLTDENFTKLFSQYLREVAENISKQIETRMMQLSEQQIRGKSMWCADGGICKLPKGSKGIDWGYGGSKIFEDNQLYVESDDNIIFRTGGKDRMVVNDGGARIVGDGTSIYSGWGGIHSGYGDWDKIQSGDKDAIIKYNKGSYGITRDGIKLGENWMIKTNGDWLSFQFGGKEIGYMNRWGGVGATSADNKRGDFSDYNHTHKYWEPVAGGKKGFTGNASDKWMDPGNKFQGN